MSVIVLTTVRVKDGMIDQAASLFEETNRALVSDQPDWLSAWFTANRERGEITNVAKWKNASSYEKLRASAEFQDMMRQFAKFFLGTPEVTINELLVEMVPYRRT